MNKKTEEDRHRSGKQRHDRRRPTQGRQATHHGNVGQRRHLVSTRTATLPCHKTRQGQQQASPASASAGPASRLGSGTPGEPRAWIRAPQCMEIPPTSLPILITIYKHLCTTENRSFRAAAIDDACYDQAAPAPPLARHQRLWGPRTYQSGRRYRSTPIHAEIGPPPGRGGVSATSSSLTRPDTRPCRDRPGEDPVTFSPRNT